MEDLPEFLRKALEKGESIRLRDPVTEKIYALREDLHAWQDEGIAPGIVRSRHAFLRDLPELLKNLKYDRWAVGYHGDERIMLAPSGLDIMRECRKRGLKDDEYYIGSVAPYDYDGEIEGTLSEFEPDE